MKKIILNIFFLIALFSFYDQPVLNGKPISELKYPKAVGKLDSMENHELVWFSPSPPAAAIRRQLLQLLDSCSYLGLSKNDYHYKEISNSVDGEPNDTDETKQLDKIYSDALFSYCLDVYCGNIKDYIVNDEISHQYADTDQDVILKELKGIRSLKQEDKFLAFLEPVQQNYLTLKKELRIQLSAGNTQLSKQLSASLNLYRWIYHFHFNRLIVVNIASNSLKYYEGDTVKLEMEVVVGKPSTKTPRLATWCHQVTLYPYWNVPRDIGVKELLPKCKKDIGSKELQEMQLVSNTGDVLELGEVDFSLYNKHNFPFTFRQTTGCTNALGVIKFELTDPFDVYMHDTNFKNAFLSEKRYFSHGCIRLQKPLELGDLLLNNKIDSDYVKSCIKEQNPVPLKIAKPVPVFVVYMTAAPVQDSVQYYNDVYNLF